MRFAKQCGALALCAALLLGSGCAVPGSSKEPITLSIWHYYNGMQQQSFDRLVSEFNDTVGEKSGIVVESVSQGGVADVAEHLADSLSGKAGAAPLPNAAALYADSAYSVYERGLAVNLNDYLSKKERAAYVPAYFAEGQFGGDDAHYLFPVAKSTEVFLLNETDFAPFAAATGATDASFATWEGITAIAQQYYEWTDAQTPAVPNDGRAFFGRDAMANYLLVGARQLGAELFSVQNGKVTCTFDDAALRRLWDNYYVPYVNGWFTAVGRFRSDDVKTGDCIALVGSTSGAAYFPTDVTRADGTSYPIAARVYPLPNFEGTRPHAVQQGASMLLLKSDRAHEAATVEFFRWLTQRENGLTFCLGSGYLPVMADTTAQEVTDALRTSNAPDALQQALLIGTETAQTYELCTSAPFKGGVQARAVLDKSLPDRAKADRERVLALVAQGTSAKAAVAAVATDDAFSAWVSSLKTALQAVS